MLGDVKESDRVLEVSLSNQKWRNILFDKNGRSHLGLSLWDSKELAAQRMREVEFLFKDTNCTWCNVLYGRMSKENYSWSMQLPVGGSNG